MTAREAHAIGPIFNTIKAYSFHTTLDVVQRWLTIGTGIGIEIRGSSLNVVVVRIRPKGPTVVGQLEICSFDERPASEWKKDYKTFLQQLGVSHTSAVILLPWEDISCRSIKLPGVIDKLLPAALNYEMDSLFPWAREEPVYDWIRMGTSSSILVAMTTRRSIERYTNLFKQADIKVSHFTCEPVALHASAHMFRPSHSDSFLAIGGEPGELILYGESPSTPLFAVRVDMPFDKACSRAIAELRLNPDTKPMPIKELVPAAVPSWPATDPVTWSMAYVAALCAANPWFGQTVNLLPRDQRRGILRSVYLPTAALLTLLVVAAGVLTWFSTSMAKKNYRMAVLAAIETVEPQARKSDDLDHRIAALRNEAQTINAFRMRSKDDLDAFSELTQLIMPPTWVHSLLLTRRLVLLTGEAEQAAPLLKVIDSSTQFSASQFSGPVAREGRLEGFVIRATRKVTSHEVY